MVQVLRRGLRGFLPEPAARFLRAAWVRTRVKATSMVGDPLQLRRPAPSRECPICGFRGRFWSYGVLPRADALCPQCLSIERHRLFQLFLARRGGRWLAGKRVLHFAPEGFIRERLGRLAIYVTADVAGGGVDCRCRMEAMPFVDRLFDVVIAHHVLEHVEDDGRAMREIRRVMARDGVAILSVPIIQGWHRTYEDDRIQRPEERRAHFGQEDHKRLYGRDFVKRLSRAGFAVEVFQADPKSEVTFGLQRGDQLFIAWPRD
jgi:SAM-dependent methyltransferase